MEETNEIISILSDEQSREIINLLSKTELTTQQVANLLNIPQSTAYRKMRTLIRGLAKCHVSWKQ
jgi:transcriptional regulator of acetoin/glycerol metabolism